MRVLVTAPRSELGRVLARAWGRDQGRGAPVVINLALQPPNTLLHDGHAWWRDPAQHIRASTRRVLATAQRDRVAFLVHASYAFIQGAEGGGPVGERMRAIAGAARDAEEMVLDGATPACVVRLGYLYGAEWRDLRAYRSAFRLGRPYWAGPRRNLQHHLYGDDAAASLIIAAQRRSSGRVSYATDGRPASFADFMDHFAHLVGRSRPLHLPGSTRPLAHLVVDETHMQMVETAATGPATPRLPGWRPRVTDHRDGLAEVVAAWGAAR
ncbi:MAG: NAD-dependent epimerase/dehydratase family protein [Candidatus Dormibacteria bacterium]